MILTRFCQQTPNARIPIPRRIYEAVKEDEVDAALAGSASSFHARFRATAALSLVLRMWLQWYSTLSECMARYCCLLCGRNKRQLDINCFDETITSL